MALYLVRAGKSGQHEMKFLEEGRIYITWEDLRIDLSKFNDWQDFKIQLNETYPNHGKNTISNYAGQLYPMVHKMQKGDWIVLPSKVNSTIHFGEVSGEYHFDSNAEDPFYHYRPVNWFATDIPRSNFDQDLLYSFGAFMSICQIKRNNAEERIRKMALGQFMPQSTISISNGSDADELVTDETAFTDMEVFSRDQITKRLIQKFKGHGFADIINEILKAKGYTTFKAPPGPDKGVDILASSGPLGFGNPRICVQVKSSSSPIDRPTLDQLIGTMQNFGAEQGLLVSWGGFKGSVRKEIPAQFFRVRLWGQEEVVEEFLNHYDQLDEDIKAEIPLKKIWTLAIGSEE